MRASARQCEATRGNARQCEAVRGSASQCEAVRASARQCGEERGRRCRLGAHPQLPRAPRLSPAASAGPSPHHTAPHHSHLAALTSPRRATWPLRPPARSRRRCTRTSGSCWRRRRSWRRRCGGWRWGREGSARTVGPRGVEGGGHGFLTSLRRRPGGHGQAGHHERRQPRAPWSGGRTPGRLACVNHLALDGMYGSLRRRPPPPRMEGDGAERSGRGGAPWCLWGRTGCVPPGSCGVRLRS
jgi:hypothetical protein